MDVLSRVKKVISNNKKENYNLAKSFCSPKPEDARTNAINMENEFLIDEKDITLDMNLFEDLNYDSLTILGLVMDLEDEFNITIDLKVDDDRFIYVKDFVNYIEKNLK